MVAFQIARLFKSQIICVIKIVILIFTENQELKISYSEYETCHTNSGTDCGTINQTSLIQITPTLKVMPPYELYTY